MLRISIAVIFYALLCYACYALWSNAGTTLTLSCINLVTLIHFWLLNFDGILGINDLSNHWNKKEDANVRVILENASFDDKSKILMSKYNAIICASELKTMQDIRFAISDTNSMVTGFKSQVLGTVLLNVAAVMLILVASKASGGSQSATINFDAHTVEAVAVSVLQLIWLTRPLHILYQRNKSHLVKISAP